MTVDWRYNVAVYRRLFPGSQVKMLPGAGHQLANESARLRRVNLGYVDSCLSDIGLCATRGDNAHPVERA